MNPDTDNIASALGARLQEQPDIRLGILFGSAANARLTEASDLDIAVLGYAPLDTERVYELIVLLAEQFGRAIDLVDLSTAGILVAREALLFGRVVFQSDRQVYPDQVTRILIDSADFLPYYDRMLEARRKAWLGE